MKVCTFCKEVKPVAEFYNNKSAPDGRSHRCKACLKTYDAMRHQKPERKAKTRARAARWGKSNPKKRHLIILKYKYGVPHDTYDRLFAEQKGVCAICESPPTRKNKWLSLDHCHTTLVVRGLLCSDCNTALGTMRDDPARLRLAADYLERLSIEDPSRIHVRLREVTAS